MDAFLQILREGQLVHVEYGDLSIYGLLAKVRKTLDNPEDVPWALEFKWIGNTDVQPQPRTRERMDPIATMNGLEAQSEELNFLMGIGIPNPELPFLTELFQAQLFVTGVLQQILRIQSLAREVSETLQKVIDLAFAPVDVVSQLRSTLTSIKLEALDVFDTFALRSAVVMGAASLDPIQTSIGNELQQRLRASVQGMAAFAARTENELSAYEVPEIIAIHIMLQGTTLRDVSRVHYRTPDNWRQIATFNGFAGSIVPPGTVVRIPRAT